MTDRLKKTAGRCPWCGRTHTQRCPFVEEIEFHPDGAVKRVRFVPTHPTYSSVYQPGVLRFERNTDGS